MTKLRVDEIPAVLHVIPLRSAVLFPGGVLPMQLGPGLDHAAATAGEKGWVVVSSAKNHSDPVTPDDVFDFATVAQIKKFDRQRSTVEIWGVARCRLEFVRPCETLRARVIPAIDPPVVKHANRETLERMRMMAFRIFDESPDRPPDMPFPQLQSLNHLIDFVTANAPLDVQQKQRVLEAFDFETRFGIAQDLWSQAIAKFPPLRIAGAACTLHELPATETCARCGVFMCGACLMATTTKHCSNCRDHHESETMFTRLSRALGFRS